MLEFFFFTFFWSPEAVVLAAAARQSHEGSGLVAEVLGGGFGRRTTPHSMGAAPWGSSCAVEKEMIPIGIELTVFCFVFPFLFFILSFFQFDRAHAAERLYRPSHAASIQRLLGRRAARDGTKTFHPGTRGTNRLTPSS